jgi:hypothetical protein
VNVSRLTAYRWSGVTRKCLPYAVIPRAGARPARGICFCTEAKADSSLAPRDRNDGLRVALEKVTGNATLEFNVFELT